MKNQFCSTEQLELFFPVNFDRIRQVGQRITFAHYDPQFGDYLDVDFTQEIFFDYLRYLENEPKRLYSPAWLLFNCYRVIVWGKDWPIRWDLQEKNETLVALSSGTGSRSFHEISHRMCSTLRNALITISDHPFLHRNPAKNSGCITLADDYYSIPETDSDKLDEALKEEFAMEEEYTDSLIADFQSGRYLKKLDCTELVSFLLPYVSDFQSQFEKSKDGTEIQEVINCPSLDKAACYALLLYITHPAQARNGEALVVCKNCCSIFSTASSRRCLCDLCGTPAKRMEASRKRKKARQKTNVLTKKEASGNGEH